MLLSTFTHSVGAHTAGHTLPSKLRAIAEAGYHAVEIFQDDLDSFASSDEFNNLYRSQTPPDSPPHLRSSLDISLSTSPSSSSSSSSSTYKIDSKEDEEMTAWNAHGPCKPSDVAKEISGASYIAQLCSSLGLKIVSLQPMRDVEGWTSPKDRQASMNRIKSRFPIMRALETDLLLICSNNQYAPATTGNSNVIANDLREVADEAARYDKDVSSSPPQQQSIRIAYEALSWGAHVDTWSQAWEIVQKVDRFNVGLCLDSFNTLGREFADPSTISGIQEPIEETCIRVKQSIEDLKRIPGHRIFFLQVADAKRMETPLESSPNEKESRPSRMIWSRGNRLFPGEIDKGAFLPVVDFVKAVVNHAGYKGPISNEVFNASLYDQGVEVEQEHARRGVKGLQWLVEQIQA